MKISGSSGQATEAALESGCCSSRLATRNVHNNSSRFGKWCAMHFDESGRISACQVLSYLLEKSRVVGPGDGERNYHIFYQMLAGVAEPEERASLHLLGEPAEYLYLQGPTTVDGVDDKDDWAKTGASLGSLGFSDEQRGSTRLRGGAPARQRRARGVGGRDAEHRRHRAARRGSEPPRGAHRPEDVRPLARCLGPWLELHGAARRAACLDTRDALAKALYKALFDWVVSRLNAFMSTPRAPPSTRRPSSSSACSTSRLRASSSTRSSSSTSTSPTRSCSGTIMALVKLRLATSARGCARPTSPSPTTRSTDAPRR